MDEVDVKQWLLENNETSCYLLFVEKFPKAEKKLNKAMAVINKVMEEVQQEFPDANYYFNNEGFSLMLGLPHRDEDHFSQQELVALSLDNIKASDCGDW